MLKGCFDRIEGFCNRVKGSFDTCGFQGLSSWSHAPCCRTRIDTCHFTNQHSLFLGYDVLINEDVMSYFDFF